MAHPTRAITRRHFLAGTVAATGAVLLPGCGADDSSSSSGTIHFWSDQLPGSPTAIREGEFFRSYEGQNPGVKIEEHRLAKFDTQYKAGVGAGQPSDVVCLNVQYLRDYVRSELVQDITDVLDPVKSRYLPMTWTQMQTIAVKDGTFGLPLYLNTTGIYYNKKIFNDLGLAIPQTWDDMRAISATLNGKGIAPIVYAGAEPWWNPMWFNLFFYQRTDNNGIDVNDRMMRGEVSFDSEPYARAIQDIVDLDRDKVLMTGNQGLTFQTATAAFVQGKAAMYYMGNWFMSSLPASLDYGIFPTPTLRPSLKSQPPGSVSSIYSMSTSTKNRAAAAKLITAMTTAQFQKPQMEAAGAGVPLQTEFTGVNKLPAMRDLEKIAPSTVVWLDALWEPEVITAVQQGVQAAIAGTSSPAQVTANIANLYKTLRSQGRAFFK